MPPDVQGRQVRLSIFINRAGVGMLEPKCEAELSEMIAAAQGQLAVRGGGTRDVMTGGERLNITRISGIVLYEPGALTLVARGGTPLVEIDETLALEGQRMAFEPPDYRDLLGCDGTPTIGGAVATNASGPRRIQVGAARDFAMGVCFVDGRGTVVRNGGRVMKNVTGYDLVKLMAGSWGTLGVLTEIALKVMPRAETEATVTLGVNAPEVAVTAMACALGSPFEISGAAFNPQSGKVMLRVEGFQDQVRYRSMRVAELLEGHGTVGIETQARHSATLWRDIRDVAAFRGLKGDVWRVSCRPSFASTLLVRARAECTLLDWGGGLVWLLAVPGTDMRARLGMYDGHATLLRSDAGTRARLGMFQPKPISLAALERGLRTQFDPKGLFNPGLMEVPGET